MRYEVLAYLLFATWWTRAVHSLLRKVRRLPYAVLK